MRVLLDTTYAARAPFSGTAVYLASVREALERLPSLEIIAVSNPRRGAPAGGGLGSAANALADLWWIEVELPRLARARGAEVIHHPLPAIALRTRAAQVVTVHDLAFERLPEAFDPRFRRYARWAHRAAARRADAVICVSETTAADVRELWGIPEQRIVVARHGPGQQLPAVPRTEHPSHFLYVGDAEPRKNLPALLTAYAQYRAAVAEPLPLVLAGAVEGGDEGVQVERGVTTERLAVLYAGAAALVHPSLYEGFGLTVLEAMRAGVPVIAADAPGVREVCGEAALYVNVRGLADAMASVAADEALRRRHEMAGRERAGTFSWSTSAEAHAGAYSLALGA